MVSWQPASREPDALRATLYDYLRNRAAQVFLDGSSTSRPLGRADMVMSDGRVLAIDLSVTPLDIETVNGRAAIVFGVAGHAAEKAAGYEVNGRIVLDRETLAFLAIEANPVVVNQRR